METSNEKIKSLDKAISSMALRIEEIQKQNEKITSLIKNQTYETIETIKKFKY